MSKKFSRISLVVLLLSIFVVSCLISGGIGAKLANRHQTDLECCGPLTYAQTLPVALQELLGLITFNSDKGQDRWLLLKVFPDVKHGYFVDVGSGDGTRDSATKALEERGWKGICVDPFPTRMEGRTCTSYKKVVYSKAGHTVSFRAAGDAGGIEEHLGTRKRRKVIRDAEIVKLETTTLNTILAEAGAPEFIHYINLDIEGAELEALKGFDFSKYKVGAFTIEHNYEQPYRTQIKNLMEANGYTLERERFNEDWYVAKTHFLAQLSQNRTPHQWTQFWLRRALARQRDQFGLDEILDGYQTDVHSDLPPKN